MPTYEYLCGACGFNFEREQRITEDPIRLCPSCGASQAKRQITQSNFILKGGGWYADLYSSSAKAKPSTDKPDSTKPDSTAVAGSSSTDAKASESKATEAKPAATPASPSTSDKASTAEPTKKASAA